MLILGMWNPPSNTATASVCRAPARAPAVIHAAGPEHPER
jgi:hypothetical protein